MPDQINDPMEYFRSEILEMLASALKDLGLGIEHEIILETPPHRLGDFAFPCFDLAPVLKIGPAEIAKKLEERLPKHPNVTYDAKGPYLNFQIGTYELVKCVIPSIFKSGVDYGSHPKKGVKIILEHTSANPTDKLHVGRARNPIIGDTLARILRAAGYNVETQYYVDDMGKQTARKILESRYPDWDREKYKTGYQWATSATTVDSPDFDPEMVKELDVIMADLENADAGMQKEGEEVCNRMMDQLIIPSLEKFNVSIDNYVNESRFMMDGSVNEVIDTLKESEHQGFEEGAYYIDLNPFGVKSGKDKFFFLRGDGKSLYATRDIAYHLWKFQRCDAAINILGEDHKLEAEYVRVGLELTKSEKFPENIFYAFVNLPEGRMSTRLGKVVYIDDLLDEAVELAKGEVKKRRNDLAKEDITKISRQVGVGAIRYNIIRVQAEKKIVFRWEDALNFEGNSAPFIQYSHARACSILHKAEQEMDMKFEKFSDDNFRAELMINEYELMLVRALAQLPGVVSNCAKNRKTHILAGYAHDLAAAFNQFYRECPVLQAESTELARTRLDLVDATRHVLRNTLELLGIAAPERM